MARGLPGRKAEVGAWGEQVAAAYLESRGFSVLERNFRSREGEIDIVARDGDCLVFVEVRTRSGSGFGSPEESVTAAKKRKLVEVAQAYLQSRPGLPPSWRIDVVAVELGPRGRLARVELIENAVP